MEMVTGPKNPKFVLPKHVLQPNFTAVRQSEWLSLSLSNVLFERRFVELWNEHVDGFKQIRREKTGKDRDMEWRHRQKRKREAKTEEVMKVNVGAANTHSGTTLSMRSSAIEAYKLQKKRRSYLAGNTNFHKRKGTKVTPQVRGIPKAITARAVHIDTPSGSHSATNRKRRMSAAERKAMKKANRKTKT